MSARRGSLRCWIVGVVAGGALIGSAAPASAAYAPVVLGDTPAGYWRLGEFSNAQPLNDETTNNNDGVYVNGPTVGVPGALSGDPNTAASFDGVDDLGRVPDSASLDVGDTFSAEGWIKRSSTVKTHQLMTKGDLGLQLMVMPAGSANQVWLRKTNVSTIARSTAGVPADGRYHHVVATKSGANSTKIYIDGVEAGTVQVSGAQIVQNTASALTFGTSASSAAAFDELALYPRVLSAAEVLEHFQAAQAAGDTPPVAVADSAPVVEDSSPATLVNVLGNDTDVDGGPKTIASATDPAHGTVLLTGGSAGAHTGLTYQPDPNYCNTPPGSSLDTFSYALNPGGSSATVSMTVTCVNDPPVLDTTDTGLAYPEEGGPVAADTGITVTDLDSAQLQQATVAITSNFVSAQDQLAFADQLGITGSYNDTTGVMTLTGPASVASFQTALRAVTYENVSADPNPLSRQLTFIANDASSPSAPATRTINITAVNDAPVVTTSGGSAAFTVGGSPVVVDSGLTVTDPDSTQLTGATVSISANLTAGDALNFTPAGSITGVGAGTGTLTLSGAGTPAQYQAVLRSVTYQGTAGTPASRTISFRVTDSSGTNSNIATRGVTVAAAGNSAPVVTTTGGSTAYTENAAPVTVDGGLTVVDGNDTNLESLQVRISAGFESGDILAFTPAPLSGSYAPGTGILTLSGTATVATYQTVLRSVQFSSTSENPAVSKTIEFKVNDGDVDSNLATKAIAVTRVNDAPVADNDAFGDALGNTRFVVGTTSTGPLLGPVPGDVLDGDTDPDTPAANLTAGPASITSTACAGTCTGNVTMEADGQFIYDPAPGFTGSDTFTYTVSDNSAVAPANQTATGTVTIKVVGPVVWYVDGDASAAGDGRSHSPSKTLSALSTGGSLDALDKSFDVIFVYSAASSYTGGIVLEDGQNLFGEPHSLDVDPSGNIGLINDIVPAGGSNPVIVNASGDGVNLALGNEIQGIDLGNASGTALFGNFVSSATMNTETPGAIDNQTGGAVDISLGTLLMNFTSVSSTGGVRGLKFDHTQGQFIANGGTLSNATDTDVVMSGNNSFDSMAFTYGGAISDDSGPLIRISNQSGGDKRFTGPITDLPATPDNGGGIVLQNNFGGDGTSTIRFDGGLTLSTGTSDAVVDNNGGTLAITDPGGVGVGVDNTLATTTGIALNLSSATIHDDDLTFRSIKTNGAPSGIRLGGVFNGDGRLNVTGNGGACTSAATCSGGAIQNSTGDGISLGGVVPRVSLSRMQVSDSGAHGIHAIAADGVDLASSRVVDNGDAADEHGLAYENVAGSWSIKDTVVTGSADDNLHVANTSNADPLAFSLGVTGSTFASTSPTTGGRGADLLFVSEGSADVNITGSTFAANRRGAIFIEGVETPAINARLKSNTVTGGNAGAPFSESGISVNGSAPTRVEIDDNAISGTQGIALQVFAASDAPAEAQMDATITSNTIGDGTALSGSALNDAVVAQSQGSSDSRFAIRNNTIRNYAGRGLLLFATGTATADYTVTQNTISDPNGSLRPGVDVQAGNSGADTAIMCADIGGAGVENSLGAAGPSGGTDVELDRKASADLRLPGFVTGGDVQAYIAGRNLGSPTVSLPGLAPTGQAGGCTLPALPPPPA